MQSSSVLAASAGLSRRASAALRRIRAEASRGSCEIDRSASRRASSGLPILSRAYERELRVGELRSDHRVLGSVFARHGWSRQSLAEERIRSGGIGARCSPVELCVLVPSALVNLLGQGIVCSGPVLCKEGLRGTYPKLHVGLLATSGLDTCHLGFEPRTQSTQALHAP